MHLSSILHSNIIVFLFLFTSFINRICSCSHCTLLSLFFFSFFLVVYMPMPTSLCGISHLFSTLKSWFSLSLFYPSSYFLCLINLAFSAHLLCFRLLELLSIPCSLHYLPLSFSSHFFCSFLLLFSSFPLVSNSERGRPFCGGWGKVDTMWPCWAASPHRAGPQPGVTDGFFLLFSSAVEHRPTWWNHPSAV